MVIYVLERRSAIGLHRALVGAVVRYLDAGRVGTASLDELTDLGRSREEPLVVLAQWVDDNWPYIEAHADAGRLRRDGRNADEDRLMAR
jgi:hypothetical protein